MEKSSPSQKKLYTKKIYTQSQIKKYIQDTFVELEKQIVFREKRYIEKNKMHKVKANKR